MSFVKCLSTLCLKHVSNICVNSTDKLQSFWTTYWIYHWQTFWCRLQVKISRSLYIYLFSFTTISLHQKQVITAVFWNTTFSEKEKNSDRKICISRRGTTSMYEVKGTPFRSFQAFVVASLLFSQPCKASPKNDLHSRAKIFHIFRWHTDIIQTNK